MSRAMCALKKTSGDLRAFCGFVVQIFPKAVALFVIPGVVILGGAFYILPDDVASTIWVAAGGMVWFVWAIACTNYWDACNEVAP